jgi:5-(carboxyamino)imidazole ribonucleotide mutase
MKVLVLFASKSDETTYNKIASGLKERGVDYELRIASAHKTPDKVEEIINNDYDVIVSGAGLAAHLSGVIAARKIVPVLGVPCQGAYNRLDSFLSIVQMPPGIPVLCVSEENVVKELEKILSGKSRAAVIGDKAFVAKAITVLKELNVNCSSNNFEKEAVNIAFVNLGEKIEARDELVIYCPVAESTDAEDAIKAMKAANHGMWVGVNRYENAAVAAAEILGKKEELMLYRKKLAEKVIKADEEVRK